MTTYGVGQEVNITAAESTRRSWDQEDNRLAREHDIAVRKLELDLIKEKNYGELEIAKLEAKWNSWVRIPLFILKLPLLFILALSYPLFVITKQKPPTDYWRYMK